MRYRVLFVLFVLFVGVNVVVVFSGEAFMVFLTTLITIVNQRSLGEESKRKGQLQGKSALLTTTQTHCIVMFIVFVSLNL